MITENHTHFCSYCMNPVKEGEPCGECGLTAGSYTASPHHLPPQTVLMDRYLVGRVLGEGGFGITYIGCDLKLELKVAIKEYFPSDKVTRHSQATLEVSHYTGLSAEIYEKGKTKFLNEARTMAMMDKLPEIVGVRDFFEENNTAYIVMEYVEGTTLKELVDQRGGRIGTGELLGMMEPLFFALSAMHGKGLIHRDISPDNIMLENGEIRLLDFGCARESLHGTETMTIALKHGYAPIEQYQQKGQGPWTDVYGLCATIYYCLTGRVPAQALDRLCEDELILPRRLGVELTENQERALLYGMGIRPKQRCQSVRELYAVLYKGVPAPEISPQPELEMEPEMESEPEVERESKPETEPEPETKSETDSVLEHKSDKNVTGSTSIAARIKTWFLDKNFTKRQKIAGASAFAALVLCVVVLVTAVHMFGSNAKNSLVEDGEVETGAIFGELPELAPNLFGSAVAVAEASEKELKNAISGDSESITWDGRGRIELTGRPLTLTKPLRIGSDAELELAAYLTVSDGGILIVEGTLENNGLLHIEGSGLVFVRQKGALTGVSCVWMEREENFIVEKGGKAELSGSDFSEIGYNNCWFMVVDEEETFKDAIHVTTVEELEKLRNNISEKAVVIDADLTLPAGRQDFYFLGARLLIPEGVTVTAQWPASLSCCGRVCINRGTIRGRIYPWMDNLKPYTFINYGTVEGCGSNAEGNIINLGTMGADGVDFGEDAKRVGNLYNIGTLTHTGKKDGEAVVEWMDLMGCRMVNLGTLRMDESAYEGTDECSTSIEKGSVIYNHGEIVLDGGRLKNNGEIRGYGSITANSGRFYNYGTIYLSYAPSAARAGTLAITWDADCNNYGAICYSAHAKLDLPVAPERFDGAMLEFDLRDEHEEAVYAASEEELRAALADSGCPLVFVAEDIVLESAVTVEKMVVFLSGKSLTAADGMTVRGKGGVYGGTLALSGGTLTVTDGASVFADKILDCGGLAVQNRGTLVLAQEETIFASGVGIALESGGRVCVSESCRLDEAALTIGKEAAWVTTGDLEIEKSRVEIAAGGRLEVTDGYFLMDEDSALTNKGDFSLDGRELSGKYNRMNGSIVNYHSMDIRNKTFWDGSLVNYDRIEIYSWRLTRGKGTIDNQGEIEVDSIPEESMLPGGFQGTYTGKPVVSHE